MRGFQHEKMDLGYVDLDSVTSKRGRRYIDPSGIEYPSVTTILKILSEDSIRKWRKRVGEEEANRVSSRASSRGTQVHSIVEDYLNNEDTRDYFPHVKQSLQNLRQYLINLSEGSLVSKLLFLVAILVCMLGRCDCIAEFDGVPSIVDFKTSRRVKKKEHISNYFAQASAYAIMFEERTGLAIPNTVIVMDVDESKPIVFKEHRDNYVDLLLETKAEYDRRQLFFK